ncbi:hypothetical protein GCM10010279_22400 [Streptomyces mutabilis]|nr:CBS domain-containing protein [Streptomyces mutabilis]GGQ14452.1 hypothetical protein GCM10010279_22400 [Streptomyces mutabilis]
MTEYVREVVTSGVAACRQDSSVVEAAQLMRTQNIGDVVVADGRGVVGLITDRDITVRARPTTPPRRSPTSAVRNRMPGPGRAGPR